MVCKVNALRISTKYSKEVKIGQVIVVPAPRVSSTSKGAKNYVCLGDPLKYFKLTSYLKYLIFI